MFPSLCRLSVAVHGPLELCLYPALLCRVWETCSVFALKHMHGSFDDACLTEARAHDMHHTHATPHTHQAMADRRTEEEARKAEMMQEQQEQREIRDLENRVKDLREVGRDGGGRG